MPVLGELKGASVNAKLWIPMNEVESSALDQIRNVINLPWTVGMAVMPDCVSIDTEILTDQGFKLIKDLLYSDMISNVDVETKTVYFKEPKNILIRQLRKDEEIYDLCFPVLKTKIVCTEGHRHSYIPELGIKTKNLPTDIFIKDFLWGANGLSKPIIRHNLKDEEVLLLAWIVGDGSIKKTVNAHSVNKRIRFGFKKQRKINRVLELCKAVGIVPKVIISKKQTEIYFNTVDSVKFLELVGDDKNYPQFLLTQLARTQAVSFLEECLMVDGDYENHIKYGSSILNSTRKRDLDFLSAMASINFGTARVIERKLNSSFATDHKCGKLSIISNERLKCSKSGLHNYPGTKSLKLDYKDKVACVECDSGFFIARQNGRTFVTGNCHMGVGATIGSVIVMDGAVCPSAVGVDIACGMNAVKTKLDKNNVIKKLDKIYEDILERIPVGFTSNESVHKSVKGLELWSKFSTLAPEVQSLKDKSMTQIGTLGGGNHFIELSLDTDDGVWVVLHSGSRHIGKSIADVYIAMAKKLPHNSKLPDKSLSVLLANTGEYSAYMNDLMWAQEYARCNRERMMNLVIGYLEHTFNKDIVDLSISCHHNFAAIEEHGGKKLVVSRKGAISAQHGQLNVIPGSMGTKTYIVKGLGNPESYMSASHGAGRKMSRTRAKKEFTLSDLEEQTKGVMCRKDKGVLDEAPRAYKSIEKVMGYQVDLVEPIYELKQLMCIKG